MGRKLLFIMGIVLAHGALAAGLAAAEGSEERKSAASTCAQDPEAPLHYAPPQELLAYVVRPPEPIAEVAHP